MFATEQCLLVLSHHPDVWIMAAQYLDQTAKHLTEKAVCINLLIAAFNAQTSLPAVVSVNFKVFENHFDCDKICAINSSFFDDDCFNPTRNVVLFHSTEGEMRHLMLNSNYQMFPKTFTKRVLFNLIINCSAIYLTLLSF